MMISLISGIRYAVLGIGMTCVWTRLDLNHFYIELGRERNEQLGLGH